ncbi:MAG: hypothetical protein KDC52_06690 [Ignavibacteriae bacterium]|jgi:outer membrane murein-binding lipoprotein Lpp|nr:hypothetical protein [Ignavibacteriota bacterium]MCB0751142.1 hypothetical protein [Ignavibacteriota bacterium]MCB9247309.1 hypothetical protein [Ignavibacteriales bacterium]
MNKIKKHITTSLAVVFLAGSLSLAGCGGIGDEEMAQLNALRSEVSALGTEVNTLKSEKTKLEREVAEMEAKLAQCAKDKEATTKNLQKLGL